MISVIPRILKDDPTAQEFVNELNLAQNYQEPAKRKYDNRSQFDFLIVLFEYVLQALFLCWYRFMHISVVDSGNGEKNGNDNRTENQGMQKK